MSVDEMREKVAYAYGGDNWKKRVRFMPDDQIIALYYKFKKNGRIKE